MKKLILALIAVIINCSACDSELIFPEAEFSVSNYSGRIEIENTSRYATEYKWDFGNGETSEEKEPMVYYTDSGTYTIKLTAKGKTGETTISREINVTNSSYRQFGFVNFDSRFNEHSILLDGEEIGTLKGVYKNTGLIYCLVNEDGRLNYYGLKNKDYTFTIKRSDGKVTRTGTISKSEKGCGPFYRTVQ